VWRESGLHVWLFCLVFLAFAVYEASALDALGVLATCLFTIVVCFRWWDVALTLAPGSLVLVHVLRFSVLGGSGLWYVVWWVLVCMSSAPIFAYGELWFA